MTRSARAADLANLLDAHVAPERLATGMTWTEGPVWLPGEEAVLFSEIFANRIMRWDARTGLTVHRTDVEFTNGRTLDRDGVIVQCSHGRRAVEREHADGSVEVLVDRFGAHRLNSPNDVVVSRDGSVWFTDPPYGITQPREGHPGRREYGDNFVFRFDPATGDLRPVVTDVEEPNGLAFSPDERLLYVADSSGARRADGNRLLRVYDLTVGVGEGAEPDTGLVAKNGRVFAVAERGVADGFRVDEGGNVWTSDGDAVAVLAADGTRLGEIVIGEIVGNVCFGGRDGSELYIVASSSLYRLPTRTRGAGLHWLGS
jgi:gluconolactonase